MLRSDPVGAADTAWYVVVDLASGRWLSVQPAQRRYVEVTAEDDDAPARRPSPGAAAPPISARPLGLTKTLAGVRAEGFEVRAESGITRGWMTTDRDLGSLVRALDCLAQVWAQPADEGEEMDAEGSLTAHGFPMLVQRVRVMEGDVTGYEIEETVSVERKAVSQTLFAVPAGYRRITFEEMVREAQQRLQQKP
jgi:hypothetical protein